MKRRLRTSTSVVVAFVCGAVLASAGTATAAKLITGKQIKDSSITSADLKNGTVGAVDLSAAVLAQLAKTGARGPAGAQGLPGSNGADGAQGAPGPQGPGAGAFTGSMDRDNGLSVFFPTVGNLGARLRCTNGDARISMITYDPTARFVATLVSSTGTLTKFDSGVIANGTDYQVTLPSPLAGQSTGKIDIVMIGSANKTTLSAIITSEAQDVTANACFTAGQIVPSN